MVLSSLTPRELVRHVENSPKPTPAEAELARRLAEHLDELKRSQERMRTLELRTGPYRK